MTEAGARIEIDDPDQVRHEALISDVEPAPGRFCKQRIPSLVVSDQMAEMMRHMADMQKHMSDMMAAPPPSGMQEKK